MNLSPEDLMELATEEGWWHRCTIKHIMKNLTKALDPKTDPVDLGYLATDDYYYVRCKVAENPNTSQETLKKLATDKDHMVRISVAMNPNITPDVVSILLNYDSDSIDHYLANNSSTPLNVLNLLTRSEDVGVQMSAKEMIIKIKSQRGPTIKEHALVLLAEPDLKFAVLGTPEYKFTASQVDIIRRAVQSLP